MNNKVFYIALVLYLLSSFASLAQNKTSRRVRLKKNEVSGKCYLSSEMMSTDNTTYIIKYAYDLNGQTLIIPNDCNLKFKRNGSISNGIIVFSNTWLKNERFENIEIARGSLLNKEFKASRYGFKDDTEKLKFLFSQAKDGYTLTLEKRTYHINSLKGITRVRYDSSFALFNKLSGISILGDKTTIEDSASKSLIGNYLYNVLQFDGCDKVKIKGVTYIWSEQATLHPKVEGIVFLRTVNECSNMDIDISVKNAGRAIYSGRWNDKTDPGRGICDSRISVVADHVGYPVAIEKGDNLDIVNYFTYAHRGTYLAGVTNSKVHVEGKEAYSTRVNLLLTDTSDANGTYFCDNIKATVIDTGSEKMMNSVIMAQCNTYPQSDAQFEGRQPYNVSRIELTLFTPEGSSTSFEGFVYTDMAQIGDKMNITVTGKMLDTGGNSRLTRLRNVPLGNIVFKSIQSDRNYIIINSAIPDGCNLVFEDCPNIVVTLPSQQSATTGSIVFKGCSFKRLTKKNESGTNIFPQVTIDSKLIDE